MEILCIFFREFLVLGDVRACHKADTRASLNPLATIVDEALTQQISPLSQPSAGSGRDSLPPNWEKHWSDQYGTHYYWNKETGQSTWDVPTA